VEGIGKKAKIEWMNNDYEQAISEAIDDYNTDFAFGNPFLSTGQTGVRRFYRDVHKRLNDPNLYDIEMEKPEDIAYLKAQDEALRLDIQGEEIPATYNEPYRELGEDLISSYKMTYPSLKKDPKFNIYNFQDRSDPDNVKLIPDGIRKIHAYAIKKDGQDFINNKLPERAAAYIKNETYEYDAKDFREKLKDGTVQKYLLEDSPDSFLKSESIEKIIKNVEDSLDTKILPEDLLGKNEIFAKEQVPITTKTETMLKGLQASIVLAKKQGLNKIIIPSYRQFDKTRGYGEPSADESVFKDMYDQAFKKAFNILKTDSKGTLKLNTKKIKIAKEGSEPSSYVDNMPHYGGADFDEDFAYEIDISNFEFDPDKQAFRFSKGGTLMDDQMELFNEGGLRDEGGQVEPESGNKVPSGSLKEEVADDIPVMMSEGEFVFPADVVRYIGLETLMKMRQDAKQGLKMMEEMGQMGNSEEATIPDDVPFEMADLIVVSGSKPKKMQSGGLLDDPRFQRPTGGETPTMTDEDKKEIEDALLKTGFGRVVMKRYVDADGNVKYIPFIDDEPQMEIPEGFELDNSAPTPPTSSGTGTAMGDSGRDDSSRINPETGLVMTAMERDRLQLEGQSTGADAGFRDKEGNLIIHVGEDGTQYTSIDNMSPEDLVGYYETFNSKLNRFAAPLASVFFGPVGGSIIAVAQSVNNKYGANGLAALEKKIRETAGFTAKHRDRLKIAAEGIRKNGAGGYQGIIKPFTTLLGGNKELSDFEKYLDGNKGDFKGAINKLNETTTATGAKTGNKNVSSFQNDIEANYLKESGVATATFPTGTSGVELSDPADRKPPNLFGDIQPLGAEQGPPVAPEDDFVFDYGFGAEGSPAQAATVERDPRDRSDRPFVTREDQIGYEATFNALKKAGSSDKDAGDLASDVVENLQKERKDRTKKRLETSFGTDYGKSRAEKAIEKLVPETKPEPKPVVVDQTPPSDIDYSGYQPTTSSDDEDTGGDQDSSDDFFSYQPNPQSTYTTTYNPPAPTGMSPGAMGGPSSPAPSIGIGGGGGGQRFGPTGGFYVGGVPTKPMKPQRLKKGGLAKPKVKPRRMKKGGLASRKK
jgi:hypothetical protein